MLKDLIVHLVILLYKFLLRLTKKVVFEPHSVVYPSCKFEGHNRVCRNTFISRSKMGLGSYLGTNCNIVSSQIGKYTCIAPNVRTTSGTHPVNFVSMHPAFYSTRGQAGFTFTKEQKFNENMDNTYHTIIGNDVWIGDSALLIEGIHIGDGAVVAAGSVVTKDVPSYAVAAGVPAKVVRYRFDNETIEKLLKIRWWNKDMDWLKDHAEGFLNVSSFISKYEVK